MIIAGNTVCGYTVHGGWFSAPRFSRVAPNLWQGAVPPGTVPDRFRTVICLYPWESYVVPAGTRRIVVPMEDTLAEPDAILVEALARVVNIARRDGNVLVHCQAGLNRSGLIAAYALMLDGLSADEAITHLRTARCEAVLCNPVFEEWLRRHDG